MSGSGGFPKFRCKYWSSHNCDNWVWVNGRACVYCVVSVINVSSLFPFNLTIAMQAAGRDDGTAPGYGVPLLRPVAGDPSRVVPAGPPEIPRLAFERIKRLAREHPQEPEYARCLNECQEMGMRCAPPNVAWVTCPVRYDMNLRKRR